MVKLLFRILPAWPNALFFVTSMYALCLELLKTKLGSKCPRIVRVYSEMLENQVFPIPRDSLQAGGSRRGRRYELIDKDDQHDICLHHLIRKKSNKFPKEIQEYDKLFEKNRDTPENVTDEQVCFIFVLSVVWYQYQAPESFSQFLIAFLHFCEKHNLKLNIVKSFNKNIHCVWKSSHL